MAGVLLKLGGYGLIHVFPLLIKSGFVFRFIWISLSLVCGIFVSLFCIRQTDLKSSIAYTSVAHMGIVIAGVMTLRYHRYHRSLAFSTSQGPSVSCTSQISSIFGIIFEGDLRNS